MPAYDRLKSADFDLIGNLDADITLAPDYYEFLLGKFAEMPRLGVAGTPFIEDAGQPQSHTYAHEFADLQHVSGACQMFRRRVLRRGRRLHSDQRRVVSTGWRSPPLG